MDEDVDGLSRLEALEMMQNLLLAFATGGGGDNTIYQRLRRRFMADGVLAGKLPSYIQDMHVIAAVLANDSKGRRLRGSPGSHLG